MKDFDTWNKKKKYIEVQDKNDISIREKEIWWLSLGLNIGDEEDGKNDKLERPVLILKKFNNKIAWVVPMSTKSGNPKYYFKIYFQGVESFVILSQLRLISVKRLNRIVCTLTRSQFKKIRNKIIDLLK